MNKKVILCVLVLIPVLLSTGVGNVAASSGSVTATPNSITIISQHQKTIVFNVTAAHVKGVKADNSLSVVSSSGIDSGKEYKVVVKAGTPKSIQTSHVYLSTLNGKHTVSVVVVPYSSQRSSQAITQEQKKQAQKYRNFKSQWIAKRTHVVPTGTGPKTVYQEYDPTKGPMFPGTNIPKGAWVTVSYNRTTKKPKWLFNNPNQEMAYMIKRSHAARSRNAWILAFAVIMAIIPNIIGLVVRPWYRRRKEVLDTWPQASRGED